MLNSSSICSFFDTLLKMLCFISMIHSYSVIGLGLTFYIFHFFLAIYAEYMLTPSLIHHCNCI